MSRKAVSNETARAPELTLAQIAETLESDFTGDGRQRITGLASLETAESGQLSFLFSPDYRRHLATTRASAVVLRAEDAPATGMAVIFSQNPRLAWAKISSAFDPTPPAEPGVHASATVAGDARVAPTASIGAQVVIEAGAVVEEAAVIDPGCFIGRDSRVGAGTRLFPRVVLYHDVVVGRNCILHSGAVLGADGFGFAPDTGGMRKIAQIYGVRVGDEVEIGAGTTIDRGALSHTVIGRGVKLDNQVQVGHNVRIGDFTVISGCAAIAGSTTIGSLCLIGGAVGIIDNLQVCDRVEITAMTLVSRSITEPGRYSSGTGLMSSRRWKRSLVGFAQLDAILRRLRRLERKP